MEAVVLDAGAFDFIDAPGGAALRRAMGRVLRGGGEVRCSAVTLAEVCRGPVRTRRVEAAIARVRSGQRVKVIPTEERMAKLVGAVLHESRRGSDSLADAHVVAMCAAADIALVITSDPDDIKALATALPGTRIITRRPDLTRA